MGYDYFLAFDLTGRRCVVLGDGQVAAERVAGLVEVGAQVDVYAAVPSDALRGVVNGAGRGAGPAASRGGSDAAGAGRGATGRATLHDRGYRTGDLADAFLAIATREDDLDVEAAWDEAQRERVLFAALDDLPHCQFAAPAIVRRGDLKIAVSTAGRAPALARRLRELLEARLPAEWADLVDALAEARDVATPRRVPFAEWAERWNRALRDPDGLVGALRAGRRGEVVDHVVEVVSDGVEAA